MRRCLTKPVSRYNSATLGMSSGCFRLSSAQDLKMGGPQAVAGFLYGRVVPDRLHSGCRASARSDTNGNCPAVALAGAFFVPGFAAVDAFQRIRQKKARS